MPPDAPSLRPPGVLELARTLAPGAFGLIAIAAAVVTIIEGFSARDRTFVFDVPSPRGAALLLHGLYVRAARHRRGIGSRLLAAAEWFRRPLGQGPARGRGQGQIRFQAESAGRHLCLWL